MAVRHGPNAELGIFVLSYAARVDVPQRSTAATSCRRHSVSVWPMVAQLQLLVAARGGVEDVRQRPRAAQAHLREQIDEGVDAVGRQQLAVRAAMALLAAALALRLALVALPPLPSREPDPGPSLDGGRCEFFELRFSSSVSCSTCLVSASTFAVSSALLRGQLGDLRVTLGERGRTHHPRPFRRSASSPTATPSLDHDQIRLSIRLGAENAGG